MLSGVDRDRGTKSTGLAYSWRLSRAPPRNIHTFQLHPLPAPSMLGTAHRPAPPRCQEANGSTDTTRCERIREDRTSPRPQSVRLRASHALVAPESRVYSSSRDF